MNTIIDSTKIKCNKDALSHLSLEEIDEFIKQTQKFIEETNVFIKESEDIINEFRCMDTYSKINNKTTLTDVNFYESNIQEAYKIKEAANENLINAMIVKERNEKDESI